jgi:hypothetical protein
MGKCDRGQYSSLTLLPALRTWREWVIIRWTFAIRKQRDGCTTLKFRATLHTRLGARDQYTSSTLIGGKGGNPSNFASHVLCSGDQRSTWMQDACYVYMDSSLATWHRMDHVSWSLGRFSKAHLLEVGLTRNRTEIMALQTLTTVGFFFIFSCVSFHVNRNSLR